MAKDDKVKQPKQISDVVDHYEPFYPDAERKNLSDMVGETLLIKEAVILTDVQGQYGKSDLALMGIADSPEAEVTATVASSGMVVLKKIRQLIDRRGMPCYAKVVKDEAYYDLI